MSEGNVFITTWKRTSTGYRVWVKGRPKLAAEGATFAQADARLYEVIGLETGDGENLHEYSPPSPPEPADASHDVVLGLGVEPSADMVDPQSLFVGGLCPSCLMPRGPRSAVPLAVKRIPSRVHVASVSLPRRSPGVGPYLSIYSEEFLALLAPDERNTFEWRALERGTKEQRNFFELVSAAVTVPTVGLRAISTYYGVCDVCGWKWIVPGYKAGRPLSFISRADIPHPTPSLFAVGDTADLGLAAPRERWATLVGLPATRGIKTSPIGVVTEAEVERSPTYEVRPAEHPL